MYQSCEDYFNEGITTSADYLVDPDWNGPIEGFNVYCDVDSSKIQFLIRAIPEKVTEKSL